MIRARRSQDDPRLRPALESLVWQTPRAADGAVRDLVARELIPLDAELPEGASVTVLVLDGDETFDADADTEQMLLEAFAPCARGEKTAMADLLSDLRSRE